MSPPPLPLGLQIMSSSHFKFEQLFITGAVALSTAVAPLAVQTPAAGAVTCGYSVHNEDVSSDISVDLPWVGTVDPLGGKREFGYWGNCGSSNDDIIVHSSNGDERKCVTPGETKLGQTKNEKKISGAERVGSC